MKQTERESILPYIAKTDSCPTAKAPPTEKSDLSGYVPIHFRLEAKSTVAHRRWLFLVFVIDPALWRAHIRSRIFYYKLRITQYIPKSHLKGTLFWLCRNPEFSTNGKAPVYGVDDAFSPEQPLCFAIVSYYLIRGYRSWGGCHSGRGGGTTCCSPRRALKKIF